MITAARQHYKGSPLLLDIMPGTDFFASGLSGLDNDEAPFNPNLLILGIIPSPNKRLAFGRVRFTHQNRESCHRKGLEVLKI